MQKPGFIHLRSGLPEEKKRRKISSITQPRTEPIKNKNAKIKKLYNALYPPCQILYYLSLLYEFNSPIYEKAIFTSVFWVIWSHVFTRITEHRYCIISNWRCQVFSVNIRQKKCFFDRILDTKSEIKKNTCMPIAVCKCFLLNCYN